MHTNNFVILNDWLETQTGVSPENRCVLLLELSKLCRLCLKESLHLYELKNHLAVFEEGRSVFLKEIIEILTEKDDGNNENLPPSICSECSEMVLKFYELKTYWKKTREAVTKYNQIISRQTVSHLDDATPTVPNEYESSVELKQEQIQFNDFGENSDDIRALSPNSKNVEVFQIELFGHEDIDTSERDKLSVTCSHCDESFAKRVDLTKHLKSVHKDKTLECNVCNQTFTQIQTLKRHSKIHQSDQKNKLCPFCGKCFVRTDDLRRHIRTHTNERPYACDQCDKKYKQTSELKEHMKSHSKLKSYMCNVCGKTLATRNGIYVHMKVHKNIKNHVCQTCGTRYVTAGQLSSHIKHIHSKQKPYKCSNEDCLKNFVTNIALRAHLRSHCGQKKQFECNICGSFLSSVVKLREHKQMHEEKLSGYERN